MEENPLPSQFQVSQLLFLFLFLFLLFFFFRAWQHEQILDSFNFLQTKYPNGLYVNPEPMIRET